MTNVTEIQWQDRARAIPMPLRGGPKSAAAAALVEDLLNNVLLLGSPAVRPTTKDKMRLALGALLADLFRYREVGRDGKHGLSPKDFPSSELGFGRDVFNPLKDSLVRADLINFKNGWKRVERGFDSSPVRTGGDLAFFRLSPALIECAGEAAGRPAKDHWRAGEAQLGRDAPLLVLRAAKQAGEETGRSLPFSPAEPEAAIALRDLEALNTFLSAAKIEGISFAGLQRVFNDGDVPGKRWRRGGRYYSLRGGDRYESMGGAERRTLIRLGGEPVAEVDISGSHLTILYAIRGLPFDAEEDPYDIPGIDRAAVKAWVTMSLGRGGAESNRWSDRAKEAYKEEHPGRSLSSDYRVPRVRSAVLRKHPFLHELAEDGITSLDLQWHEADILRIAMMELRESHGVPSLPVHDSLIVPASKVEVAKDAIRRGFMLHFESRTIVPRFKVKGLE